MKTMKTASKQRGIEMKIEDVEVGDKVARVGHMHVVGTVKGKTIEAIYVKWPYSYMTQRFNASLVKFLTRPMGKKSTTDTVKGGMSTKSKLNVHSIPRKATKAKLSKSLMAALNEFDTAAQEWGHQTDAGYGENASKAEQRYTKARLELHDKILQLQQRLKTATKQTGE